MTVYRKQQRAINPLVVGLAAVLIGALILGGVFLIRSRPGSTATDPLAGARAKAQEAAQGLDVFAIEYPQADQGAERAGALGALSRAQSAFDAAKADLSRIDPAAVEQIATDFATLQQKAKAGAPPEDIVPVAEQAQATLLSLIQEGSGTPSSQ